MLDRVQKRRPKRKGTPITSPKRLVRIAAERKYMAGQALKLVELARMNGIKLTAGEAMRMLEQQARQWKNPPASPITGSMERMQKHVTRRGWVAISGNHAHVIPA